MYISLPYVDSLMAALTSRSMGTPPPREDSTGLGIRQSWICGLVLLLITPQPRHPCFP